MMRLRPASTPLLLLIALALLVAGCGGSGGDQGAKDLLKRAFNTPIKSADLSVNARLELQGLQGFSGPLELNIAGPYHNNGKGKLPGLDVQATIVSNGNSIPIGITTTRKNAWLTLSGQSYELGESTIARLNRQIQQESKTRQQSALSQFGLDPLGWIDDARQEDGARVGGVATSHVSGRLDVSKMLDDLNNAVQKAPSSLGGTQKPQPLTDSQKQEVEQVVKDPVIDVYVAKSDHTVRRISVDLSFDVPAGQRSKVNGIQSGRLSFDLELSNVGSAKPITPPRNARPLSELQSQIQALAGGGSAGAGGTTTPGGGATTTPQAGSGSPPDAETFQRYADCLRKAGATNTAALQQCAAILNGG